MTLIVMSVKNPKNMVNATNSDLDSYASWTLHYKPKMNTKKELFLLPSKEINLLNHFN